MALKVLFYEMIWLSMLPYAIWAMKIWRVRHGWVMAEKVIVSIPHQAKDTVKIWNDCSFRFWDDQNLQRGSTKRFVQTSLDRRWRPIGRNLVSEYLNDILNWNLMFPTSD